MNEDVFNGTVRKFLKALGVSAQREIEKASPPLPDPGDLTRPFPAEPMRTNKADRSSFLSERM
jgi:hypothetical protein